MDRRSFFRVFGAGVAGIALREAIPLGRVWSFPSKIVVPEFAFTAEIGYLPKIGDVLRIKMPQGFEISNLDVKPTIWRYKDFVLEQTSSFDFEISRVFPS